MNECLQCGEPVKNKYCNVSCQNRHQSKFRKRYRVKMIEKIKECLKCNDEFTIRVKESGSDYEKDYCSRKCANSKTHSEETKNKIREGVVKNNIKNKDIPKNYTNYYLNKSTKIIYKNCEFCDDLMIKKDTKINNNTKFCSVDCSNEHKRLMGKDKSIIKIKKPRIVDPNKKTFIYCLEYPVGVVRYVGKSDNPERRLKRQINEAINRNKNRRDKWINSLLKIDDKPILRVIEEVKYSEWQDREMYWINLYKTEGCDLVNGTDGGEGSNGFKNKSHSEETKQKISTSLINLKNCKLSDDQVIEIYDLYFKQKESIKNIHKKYNNVSIDYLYTITGGGVRKNLFNEYFNNI